MSIREPSSPSSAGTARPRAEPKANPSATLTGHHANRHVKKDVAKAKAAPSLQGTAASKSLKNRAIAQLNNAIRIYQKTGNLAPLKLWYKQYNVSQANNKPPLLLKEFIPASQGEPEPYTPLGDRKVQKNDTDLASIIKQALKAAKNIKPAVKFKRSGGASVKTKKAALGKKRRKGSQPNGPAPDGDTALVHVPTDSNPLMSVNRKDREEGPDGIKVDKPPIHTQESKK